MGIGSSGELSRTPAGIGLRLLALAAFALAAVRAVTLLLTAIGVFERLFFSEIAARSSFQLLYNILVGWLPAILWIAIILGLVLRSRATAGFPLMAGALLTWVASEAASNIWPRMPQGASSSTLMWVASSLALLWPILFGLGLVRSRFLPPMVARLALVWGLTYAGVGVVRVLARAAFGTVVPLGFSYVSVLKAAAYVPSLFMIMFMIALGLSVYAPERLASMSSWTEASLQRLFGSKGVSNKRIEQNASR